MGLSIHVADKKLSCRWQTGATRL